MFRSEVLRWMFSWLIHPDLALKFGAWWSGKSRKSHSNEQLSVDMLAPLVEYAMEHHREHADVETYIFGHMHIPHHEVNDGAEILFLSDWSREEATYAVMESNQLKLKTFKIDETIS